MQYIQKHEQQRIAAAHRHNKAIQNPWKQVTLAWNFTLLVIFIPKFMLKRIKKFINNYLPTDGFSPTMQSSVAPWTCISENSKALAGDGFNTLLKGGKFHTFESV